MNKVHFSSSTDDWSTPEDFFNMLDKEFNFTLDPCADDLNHKCEKYYTKEQNGLTKEWGGSVCSAIPLMEEKSGNGSKNAMTKFTMAIVTLP